MKDSLEARASEVFVDASELAEEEREAFLDGACESDPELRARVEQLLTQESDMPTMFLQGTPSMSSSYLEPGSTFAGFHILRRLGEGGMGTVYVAMQSMPKREVALKVIRPGRMTARAERRFRQEVEALGNLQHPGIAQIYEAGSASSTDRNGAGTDQPYLAMELVRGEPLLPYVRSNALDLEARLELMARLCDAIQHAHQRGVIHRDLKPDNILVAAEDTTSSSANRQALAGRPVILDFGIARLVDRDATLDARETRAGELVGTLAYISPEQLKEGSKAVDARSDVYALGVVLYQLLANRLPIDVSDEELPQALRRLEHEHASPIETLIPHLRGDIATIAHKALEKNPDERYQSAFDLASDLRSYLRGDPIQARSASALYLFRRRLKRNRRSVALAIGALAIIVFGFVIANQFRESQVLAINEATAWDHADEDFSSALEAADTMFEVGRDRLADAPQSVAVRREILGTALDLYLAMVGRHNSFEVHDRVAVTRLELGELQMQLGEFEGASQSAEQILSRDEAVIGEPEVEVAALGIQGMSARQLGDYESAERSFNNMLKLATVGLEQGADWAPSQYATAKKLLAILREKAGRYAEAEALLLEGKAVMDAVGPTDMLTLEQRRALADTLMQIGTVRNYMGRSEEAELDLQASLAIVKWMQTEEPGAVRHLHDELRLLTNLGLVASDAGRLDEAREWNQKGIDVGAALVKAHPQVISYAETLFNTYNNLAGLMSREGDLAGAIEQLSNAGAMLDAFTATNGPGSFDLQPRVLLALNTGILLNSQERYEEACSYFEQVFVMTDEHKRVAQVPHIARNAVDYAHVNLARAKVELGSPHEALEAIAATVVQRTEADMHWALDVVNRVMLIALEQPGLSDETREELFTRGAEVAGNLVARSRLEGFSPTPAFWEEPSYEPLVQHPEFRELAQL